MGDDMFHRSSLLNRNHRQYSNTLPSSPGRVYMENLDDAVHLEAKSLLSQWMNDKLRCELTEETPSHSQQRKCISSRDNKCHPDDASNFIDHCKKVCFADDDFDPDGSSDDDEYTVNGVMKNLMKAPLQKISKSISREMKLKSETTFDPTKTMQQRQNQIKEARRKREEQAKLKREALQQAKEQQRISDQIRKVEEKRWKLQKRLEDEQIQREMERMKKELAERRALAFEQVADTEASASPSISKFQPAVNYTISTTESFNPKQRCSDNVDIIVDSTSEKIQEAISRQRSQQRHKFLKTSFISWYRVVLDRKASEGKAKALSDWKVSQRVWAAWRKYTLQQISERVSNNYRIQVRQMKMNDHVAFEQSRLSLLKRCFAVWKKFVKLKQYFETTQQRKEQTKTKMKALLDAVHSKARNTVVVQSLDEENEEHHESTVAVDTHSRAYGLTCHETEATANTKSSSDTNGRPKLKHAWRVNKRDIEKFKTEELLHMNKQFHKYETEVKKVSDAPSVGFDQKHYQNQKALIAKQKSIIVQQNQVINSLSKRKPTVNLLPDSSNSVHHLGDATNADPSAQEKHKKTFPLPKRPQSVIDMEQRAAQRQKRRLELEVQKREKENHKMAERDRQEEERIKKEEQEKREHQERLREERRLKKQKEDDKRKYLLWLKEANKKADDHYLLYRLRAFGWNPWRKLVKVTQQQVKVADYHYSCSISRKVLSEWHCAVKTDLLEKEVKAEQLCARHRLTHAFRCWKKYGECMSILEQRADIYFGRFTKQKYLKVWENFAINERLRRWDSEELAEFHNKKRLMKRGVSSFRLNVKQVHAERERSRRLTAIHLKVLQVLPDFQPDSTLRESHDDVNKTDDE